MEERGRLTGRYDITTDIAKYVPDLQPASGVPDIVSVPMTGLQQELGLKVESKKTSLEFLIVDHVKKAPAEN